LSDEHNERIARLTTIAERLIVAIEADIAALKDGKPAAIRTGDPEIQRLSALYAREAQNMTPEHANAAPAPLIRRFAEVTRKFRELLTLHARLLTRVRNATEGMIKAIADEVERQTQPIRTYNPVSAPYGRRPQAMLYNKVV
jgi:hypothetical protein